MYYWILTREGLSLHECGPDSASEPPDPQDFETLEDGKTWVKAQLSALLLGNPLDRELEYETSLRVGNFTIREWLLAQAKRELLHESL